MNKISFSVGSKVFHENKEYKIVRAINFSTVSIQSIDGDKVINVPIKELSSKSELNKVYLDTYSDEEWATAKSRFKAIENLVFKKRTKEDVIQVAKEYNKGQMTIYRWLKMYEGTEQISSLIPNTHKRGKKGSRINKVVDKIVEDVIEEYYLSKQKTGFPKIYMKIKQACIKLNLEPPHENTVRNRIKAIDPKLSMKKREGYKKAHKEFSNFEGEFPEGKFPLDVIQIDHTPLDIMVVDNRFRKPIGRPYLTLSIDIYTRMITGFYISLQAPGYFNVSQCLYNTFIPKDNFLKEQKVNGEWPIHGIPRLVLVDNGKDLVGLDMQRVCDEFGIILMKRPVARPQFGAHVERVLGTINKEIHNLPGTTFSNVTEKGDYDSIKNATFTLDEITQWVTEYIVNVYHKKVHYGLDMTPEEKYYIGIFGDDDTAGTGVLPSIIEDIEAIRIATLPSFYRTIQKDGITLEGITYYSDVLRVWINRKDEKNNKLKFKIKRDPMNIQKIFFYDPEIKEYFEINYKKLHAPKMTLWDMYAAKRYLKEKNITKYDENDIFEAYDRLSEIEQKAKNKTTKHKLRKSKTPKMSDIKESKKNNDLIKEDTNDDLDDLFSNVQTFNVHTINSNKE
jgi:putative transposase